VYEGPAREALKAFKLAGERRSARALAAWMFPVARSLLPVDALTWVPATRRSEAERGFVPAAELARALARALGVPAARLLVKVRATRDQAELGREARRANLAGAFVPVGPVPARVLLVDDVLTTGATIEACAHALVAGGGREVSVVTFARSL
jgi:predicted amidophosphoribosyltransferase